MAGLSAAAEKVVPCSPPPQSSREFPVKYPQDRIEDPACGGKD